MTAQLPALLPNPRARDAGTGTTTGNPQEQQQATQANPRSLQSPERAAACTTELHDRRNSGFFSWLAPPHGSTHIIRLEKKTNLAPGPERRTGWWVVLRGAQDCTRVQCCGTCVRCPGPSAPCCPTPVLGTTHNKPPNWERHHHASRQPPSARARTRRNDGVGRQSPIGGACHAAGAHGGRRRCGQPVRARSTGAMVWGR